MQMPDRGHSCSHSNRNCFCVCVYVSQQLERMTRRARYLEFCTIDGERDIFGVNMGEDQACWEQRQAVAVAYNVQKSNRKRLKMVVLRKTCIVLFRLIGELWSGRFLVRANFYVIDFLFAQLNAHIDTSTFSYDLPICLM